MVIISDIGYMLMTHFGNNENYLNGLPNEIYNIGSGEYLSNNEVAQKLLEVSNSSYFN